MKTSEIFEREIGFIKNETMRQIVADTLDASPECIQTVAASSSARYHPKADLGDGGLVRHIKTVTAVCRCLMDSDCFRDIAFENWQYVEDETVEMFQDFALAACILHDCYKPDNTPKHSTRFDHPILAARLFKKCATPYINEDNMEYMKVAITVTYNAIASHMGKWTTSPYAKGVVLPKPNSGIDIIVHLCDFIASRKFFDMNFDAYAENRW